MNTWEATRAQAGTEGILVDYTGGDIAAALNPSMPFSNQTQQLRGDLGQDLPAPDRAGLPRSDQPLERAGDLVGLARQPVLLRRVLLLADRLLPNYAGYEAVRQGNVHFAGEHCSIDYQGYMEGGAAEGQRAGLEVLGDYGLK